MPLHVWWLYVTAVFLISATPGPNMLHVMTQSIAHGPRKAMATMAGLMSAVLLCLIASALGLGALLKASPLLFAVLRYAGVAYLIWLGIKAWRAPVTHGGDGGATTAMPIRKLYGTALLTGLLVSIGGARGFVGLIVPEVVRVRTGSRRERKLKLKFSLKSGRRRGGRGQSQTLAPVSASPPIAGPNGGGRTPSDASSTLACASLLGAVVQRKNTTA